MAARVSLCMIVKNEEATLPTCLGSAADLVQEIVIVDTGSTDRTKEVAGRFGARIVDFPWVDSFAAARNESIRHATGQWIFWLDADDRLDEVNRGRLRELFARLGSENVAYMMCCRCQPGVAGGAAMIVDHARLFPNRPQIRWQYRVHEQITLAVERQGGTLERSSVEIIHGGYQDPALRRRKNERNLRLLQLDYADNPKEPITLFHLGWTCLDLQRPAEALPYLYASLEHSPPGLSSTRKTYALMMNSHYGLGQKDKALAICRQGRRYFPDDAELLFAEGKLLAEGGDLRGGEECLLRLLSPGGHHGWDAIDSGVLGYQARFTLGEIYSQQGRISEAESMWRQVVQERRDYTNAWLRLSEIWSRQGRLAELATLEQLAQEMEPSGQRVEDVLLLRLAAFVGRKAYAQACQLLGTAIAANPRWLTPRVALSQVLLQEGRDWDAAQRALNDVLALDPQNAMAHHNLAVLAQVRKAQGR
jgi:glycosyltransferase involved in cell wall biosynthesis/Tfp pilus assembly protein PilF